MNLTAGRFVMSVGALRVIANFGRHEIDLTLPHVPQRNSGIREFFVFEIASIQVATTMTDFKYGRIVMVSQFGTPIDGSVQIRGISSEGQRWSPIFRTQQAILSSEVRS